MNRVISTLETVFASVPHNSWQAAVLAGLVLFVQPAAGKALVDEPLKDRPPVYGLAFSPDGKWLAAATGARRNDGGPVLLWRVADWSRREVRFEAKGASDVAFSPDGKLLAYGTWDQHAVIVRLPTGMMLKTLRHPAPAVGVAFTPDGKSLATACHDGNVYLWSVETGKRTRSIAAHQDKVNDLDVAKGPMGEVLLLTCSNDRTAKLWKLNTGELAHTTKLAGSIVRRCAFSADGRHYLTADWGGKARLWDTQTGKSRAVIQRGNNCAQLSADNRLLAIATMNPAFHVCRIDLSELTERQDAKVRKLLRKWTADSYAVREAASRELVNLGLAAAPKLRQAMRSPDAEVRIRARMAYRQIRSPPPIATLAGDFGRGEVVCFSPDGKLLAAGCREGLIKVWETSSFKEIATLTR